MIDSSTLQFLRALKKNNNKEWFEKNRSKYENAKTDFEHFVGEVLENLRSVDSSIADLKPKDCTFRINRDVRFSKDKSPYKNNMAMYIAKGGKKTFNGGYYFHCEPGNAFIAGGIWMPMAPELKKIRQEIDYNWTDFKAIINNKKFRQTFGDLEKNSDTSLSRPPKGYEDSNAAIEYLKLKSFIARASVSDEEIIAKNFVKQVITKMELLRPLIQFINQSLDS